MELLARPFFVIGWNFWHLLFLFPFHCLVIVNVMLYSDTATVSPLARLVPLFPRRVLLLSLCCFVYSCVSLVASCSSSKCWLPFLDDWSHPSFSLSSPCHGTPYFSITTFYYLTLGYYRWRGLKDSWINLFIWLGKSQLKCIEFKILNSVKNILLYLQTVHLIRG
jgi:hypothetical protein